MGKFRRRLKNREERLSGYAIDYGIYEATIEVAIA